MMLMKKIMMKVMMIVMMMVNNGNVFAAVRQCESVC